MCVEHHTIIKMKMIMLNENVYVQTQFIINDDDVRDMCIKHKLCTCCNNKQYNELLQLCNCETHNFYQLKQMIYEIACKINDYSYHNSITNIMYLMMHECVNTFFEIIDKK